MVSSFRRSRLTLPVAPTAAVLTGLATAAGFAFMPGDTLERLVNASGLPAVVAAAEPPLGGNARAVLIMLGGGFVGLLVWFGLWPLLGSRSVTLRWPAKQQGDEVGMPPVPVLRRGDAHPDAPPRAPLFAHRELGTPFLDIHARLVAGPLDTAGDAIAAFDEEREVPDDLDMPLAAFDPAAFAAATGEPVPLPRFAPGERIETFELTPIRRDPVPIFAQPLSRDADTPRPAARDTEATITALLERLERGVSTRSDRLPRASADAARGALRRIATGG